MVIVNAAPAAATVSENCFDAVFAGEAESVTVIVNVDVAAVVGVPKRTPDVLKVRPAGRVLPPATVQVNGVVPPVAARGWL